MERSIGNCDTCDYILKCNRAGLAKRFLGGCPRNLLEEYHREMRELHPERHEEEEQSR